MRSTGSEYWNTDLIFVLFSNLKVGAISHEVNGILTQ